MKKSINDQSWQSPVEKGLWKTLWPILITHFLGISLNFADTFFMSRIDDVASGAIGSMFPLVMMYQMLFGTMGQCGVNVGSQYLGKKDRDSMYTAFSGAIQTSALTGIAIALLMSLSHPLLAKLLGLSGKALEYSIQYFSVLAPFVWIRAIAVVYSGILNATGRGTWNIYIALGNNLLNIVLNTAFLNGALGPNWAGVQGLALATVLSQLCTLTTVLTLLHLKLKFPFFFKKPWFEYNRIIKPILRIALPASAEPIGFQLAQLCFAWGYVRLGSVAMATRIYTMNILIWVILWNIALGLANQILLSELIGAKEYDQSQKQMSRSYKLGVGGAFLGLIPLTLFSGPLLGLFTENQEIISIGKSLILLSFILETGRAMNLVIGGSLRASGDSLYITIVSFIVLFVFAVPLALGLMLKTSLGLLGLWIAMGADEWIRGFLNWKRWRSGRWKTKGV